jgi:uncharacterized protein YlxW (UPF0749 family)
MKRKYVSQITVALVCCILGFMLAYQFRILTKHANVAKVGETDTDVTVEIEQYKKQKDELQKNLNDLQDKLKSYEQAAANSNDQTKNMLTELETTRLLTGEKDVQGSGIVLYLDPLAKILGNDIGGERLTDKHLVYIVNELVFAGAEAVSINDIRITPRTGIRTAGNYILIGDEKISPSSRITIKAIGNKKLLYDALSFPEVFIDFKSISKCTYEPVDNIVINKGKTYKFEYVKPVK